MKISSEDPRIKKIDDFYVMEGGFFEEDVCFELTENGDVFDKKVIVLGNLTSTGNIISDVSLEVKGSIGAAESIRCYKELSASERISAEKDVIACGEILTYGSITTGRDMILLPHPNGFRLNRKTRIQAGMHIDSDGSIFSASFILCDGGIRGKGGIHALRQIISGGDIETEKILCSHESITCGGTDLKANGIITPKICRLRSEEETEVE